MCVHICMCVIYYNNFMLVCTYVFIEFTFSCVYVLKYNYHSHIIFQCVECVPPCKFGKCNTAIGECICPPGHTGADCSVISMLY